MATHQGEESQILKAFSSNKDKLILSFTFDQRWLANQLYDNKLIDFTVKNDVTNFKSVYSDHSKAEMIYESLLKLNEMNERDNITTLKAILMKKGIYKDAVSLLSNVVTDSPEEKTRVVTDSSEKFKEIPKKNSLEIINPKPRLIGHDYMPFLEHVQYVIATFNKNEFKAATTVITSPEDGSEGVTNYANNVYLGMIKPHAVCLLSCSQGRDCEETIKRAVPLFPNAKYLVAAGVCYAFSDKECKLGDVLISNQIVDLGNYRIGEVIESRGDHTTMKDQIKGIFCFDTARVKTFQVTEEGRNAKYFVGRIVSAPNLIDDSDMKDKFRDSVRYNKVYGGEMEGGELLRLQKNGIVMKSGEEKYLQVIIIKAVSDFADGSKTNEWQFIAAQAAFNYIKDQMATQSVESCSDVIDHTELSKKVASLGKRPEHVEDSTLMYQAYSDNKKPRITTDASESETVQEDICDTDEVDVILTEDNFDQICSQLKPCSHDWKLIARKLQFKPSEISKIGTNLSAIANNEFMSEVVEYWLRWKKGDERGSSGKATVQTLQKALNDANYARIKISV